MLACTPASTRRISATANRELELTGSGLHSCLYASHQRNRAVLLLVVEEERPVRKPADNKL